MTKPDEALIWARQWRSGNLQALGLPSLAQRVADGETDETLEGFAHAYRAGQAASAARIKALKEALLNLVDRVTEDDGEGCQTSVNAAEMISARVVLLKEADQ